MSNRNKMSEDDRMSIAILTAMYRNNFRGFPKKVFLMVKRSYSTQTTQLKVSKRMFWLAEEEGPQLLMKVRKIKGDWLFAIREDKREEVVEMIEDALVNA